jgi:hypothetical protein
MTKTIEITADMGYIQQGEIAIEFYGSEYIMKFAGYEESDFDNMPENDEELDDIINEDFYDAACKLEKQLTKKLISRNMKMINNIDFDTVSIYEVSEICR